MFRKQGLKLRKRTKNYTHVIEIDQTTFIVFMKLFPLWLIYILEPNALCQEGKLSILPYLFNSGILYLYFGYSQMKFNDTGDKILNILAQTQERLFQKF